MYGTVLPWKEGRGWEGGVQQWYREGNGGGGRGVTNSGTVKGREGGRRGVSNSGTVKGTGGGGRRGVYWGVYRVPASTCGARPPETKSKVRSGLEGVPCDSQL